MKTPDFINPGKTLRYTGIGATILVIVIYYTVMQTFAIDIPFCDEYHVTLQWLDILHQLKGTWKKILHLFSQANEHRIFIFSLAVLTDYTVFGTINFSRLLWAGNLGLILLLFLVNLLNHTDRRNPWIILPVALLLFAPQNEITNWPVVAISAIYQNSMVIASLYLLSRDGWLKLAAAVLLAALATFSFGNGMVTFAAGFLVLALKKPSKPIIWFSWSMAMTVTIFFYFQNYHFIGESGRFTDALRNPLSVVQFFLTFFGTIIVRIPKVQTIWVTIGGVIPILALGYLIIFKWKEVKYHPVALSVLLFILISATLTAVSRQSFGVHGATAPRYILLQALFLSVLFLLYMNVFSSQKRRMLPLLLGAGLLLYMVRLPYGIYSLNRHHHHLKEIIVAYKTDPDKIKTAGPSPAEIKRILDRSIVTGVYVPPTVTGKEK